MKEIKLTQGKLTFVDDEDYERLMAMGKWHSNKGYAAKNILVSGKGKERKRKLTFIHRLVMNCPDGMVVDHINGNPLDNRKENLRICTNPENLRNSKIHKNNTSGFKGVVWNKQKSKWMSRLTIRRKVIFLGLYQCKKEAAKAYDTAALIYHGEFAKTNK